MVFHQFKAFLTELSPQDIDISLDGVLLCEMLGEVCMSVFKLGRSAFDQSHIFLLTGR